MTAKLTFAGLLFISAAAWAQPPGVTPTEETPAGKTLREAARERLQERREAKTGKAEREVPAVKTGRARESNIPGQTPPGAGALTPSAGTTPAAVTPVVERPAAITPSTLPAEADATPRVGGLRQTGAGRLRNQPSTNAAAEEQTDLSPSPNATPIQRRGRVQQGPLPRAGETPGASVSTPDTGAPARIGRELRQDRPDRSTRLGAEVSTPATGAPTSTPARPAPTGAPDSAAPSVPGRSASTPPPAIDRTADDTPAAGKTPGGTRGTRIGRSTPAADATPFVPSDLPDRLRDNRTQPGSTQTPTGGAIIRDPGSPTLTPRSETDQQQRARELRERLRNRREGTDKTPGATATPRTPAGATPTAPPPGTTPAAPGGTPSAPAETPAAPGSTPPGGTPGGPGATPPPAATPATPGATPATPGVSPTPPGGPGATPPPGATTPPAPGTSPTPVASPGPGSTPGTDTAPGPRRGRGGRFEGKAQPQPKLTPFAPRERREVPTGTPTPTPRPSPIAASDAPPPPGLTATPPPAPTPGATPVATPPGATPTPVSWAPPRDWSPYPGWRPPEGWKPPTGWTPPGGWSPPPGWEPSREWAEKLVKWGWKYVPTRGWVVDVRWTPPPDFVVPPGWYYLPVDSYDDYGLYYPGRVVIRPGAVRRDLIVRINRDEVYMPPPPPSSELIEIVEPPPRALPAAPPVEVEQVTVETVREVLTRERQPDAERYEGPVLVTGAIHFDYDSYAIKPESFDALDKVGEALINPPLAESIINVEGHTDADGSDEYNQKLSEQRAWSVKSYLVQKFGIDPNRLIIVGYGERAPIAENTTDEGKALNRRVEFENVTDLYEAQVVEQ